MGNDGVPETYEDFERRRWGQTAADYDRWYTELTDQTVEPMLDRARVARPVRCLDLACGVGTLAAKASALGARSSASTLRRR